MSYRPLNVEIPDKLFERSKKLIDKHIKTVTTASDNALTNDPRLIIASQALLSDVQKQRNLLSTINTKIDIRAFSILLSQKSFREKVNITSPILNKIDEIRPKLSIILYNAIFDYVFQEFDRIDNCSMLLNWIIAKRIDKGWGKLHDEQVFTLNGPKWIAQQASDEGKDLNQLVHECGLQYVTDGRFMHLVKTHHFIKQLEAIPVNEPHPILEEVTASDIFESMYDETLLMGHKIMQILIDRAPLKNIHPMWLNVVLKNAGDPRIPESHPKFRKWWQYLTDMQRQKVRGWLSGLDLKLFLEAIANYAEYSYDEELKRMYPSRKAFLEGLFDQDLVLETRLFVSANADKYLKKHYKHDELPAYEILMSKGEGAHKSLIYIKLPEGEMIEGSHSCYLRIFSPFTTTIPVTDYNHKRFNYFTLTSQVDRAVEVMMLTKRYKITHNPELTWQRKAVEALQQLGMRIQAKDVLTTKDAKAFKKKFGVM